MAKEWMGNACMAMVKGNGLRGKGGFEEMSL